MRTIVGRNPFAVAAHFKSGGGFHKDRRGGRGGARNVQSDFLAEAQEDEENQEDTLLGFDTDSDKNNLNA